MAKHHIGREQDVVTREPFCVDNFTLLAILWSLFYWSTSCLSLSEKQPLVLLKCVQARSALNQNEATSFFLMKHVFGGILTVMNTILVSD